MYVVDGDPNTEEDIEIENDRDIVLIDDTHYPRCDASSRFDGIIWITSNH